MTYATVTAIEKPASIVVNNYPNRVLSVYTERVLGKDEPRNEFEVGQFRIKYLNFIPKEYAY
jgi:hypothetical protein